MCRFVTYEMHCATRREDATSRVLISNNIYNYIMYNVYIYNMDYLKRVSRTIHTSTEHNACIHFLLYIVIKTTYILYIPIIKFNGAPMHHIIIVYNKILLLIPRMQNI